MGVDMQARGGQQRRGAPQSRTLREVAGALTREEEDEEEQEED